eukprot:761715-Hanusia_phi.AAC.1
MNAAGESLQQANEISLRPLYDSSWTLARCGFLVSGWMAGEEEEVCEIWRATLDQLKQRAGRNDVTCEWCALRWEVERLREVGQAIYGGRGGTSVLFKCRPGFRSRERAVREGERGREEACFQHPQAWQLRAHTSDSAIRQVGFGFGASVLFSALLDLSQTSSYGHVDDVYIIGMPSSYDEAAWRQARGAPDPSSLLLTRGCSDGSRKVCQLLPLFGPAGPDHHQQDFARPGSLLSSLAHGDSSPGTRQARCQRLVPATRRRHPQHRHLGSCLSPAHQLIPLQSPRLSEFPPWRMDSWTTEVSVPHARTWRVTPDCCDSQLICLTSCRTPVSSLDFQVLSSPGARDH